MKFHFIQLQEGYPATALCQIMQVSRSAYYAWYQCPAKLITAETLHLYRRAKEIFTAIRQSLGTRELSKKLRAEGFEIGREATRTLMKRLKLFVKQ